jgi:hypothetical protein
MHRLGAAAMGALLGIALCGGAARASEIDSLTGLTPGDLITCEYTFQNGNPSIPCASDTVSADGTVSFVKPNAPFDNLEYYDETDDIPIFTFTDVEGDPITSNLTPGTEYPILVQPVDGTFKSFFDVFFDIKLEPFNLTGNQDDGALAPDEQFNFDNGTSSGLPDVIIPGYTGPVEVIGFDQVSVPEPSSLLLLAGGLGGIAGWQRRRRPFRVGPAVR